MALHWDWNEKCGEATLVQREDDGTEKEFKLGLYTGNACLIMLYEWEENGEKMWSMFSFWAGVDHMKNCLGLNKKQGYTENIHDRGYQTFTKFKLDKKKCRYFKEIVAALIRAFDNITIEVVSE